MLFSFWTRFLLSCLIRLFLHYFILWFYYNPWLSLKELRSVNHQLLIWYFCGYWILIFNYRFKMINISIFIVKTYSHRSYTLWRRRWNHDIIRKGWLLKNIKNMRLIQFPNKKLLDNVGVCKTLLLELVGLEIWLDPILFFLKFSWDSIC